MAEQCKFADGVSIALYSDH